MCRTLAKVNPDYPTIYEHNAAWVRRFLPLPDATAVSRKLEQRIPLWESMLFPTGIAGRVFHTSCVSSLMFDVDDLALLRRALFEDVAADWIAADWVADHPYGPAFVNIWSTLKRSMPEGVYSRYRQGWQDLFIGWLMEYEFRDRGEIPDVDTYQAIRQLSIGMRSFPPGAEYVHDFDLTELLRKDPDLADVGEVAVYHTALVNDLLSFRKEYFQGEYCNIIISLMQAGHDLQEAVDITGEKIREADTDLARLCDILRLRYTWLPQVQIYLDTINSICAGNLRWSYETTRYHGRGYGWNGLRSGNFTMDPDRTIIC
ncbi:terpene synthase [Nocardia terpenica]|uniref:Terpene synthase n=1 Tax=Nocardia terpenica TaxID=455432 RepID=A0A291RPV3_9NOCA|nr:terpene synthase [Nocardia terpenica]